MFFFSPTALALQSVSFSMKEHAMAKRKARENERLGIQESQDDEELPWRNEEEQRKVDDEEAQRQRELAEATTAMLKAREAQDKLKRDKFKQWRADQIGKIKNRDETNNTKKQQRQEYGREIAVDVSDKMEQAMSASGDFKVSESDAVVTDVSERRREHRSMMQEIRRQERDE